MAEDVVENVAEDVVEAVARDMEEAVVTVEITVKPLIRLFSSSCRRYLGRR